MKEQSVKHWMRRLVCYGVGMLVLTCGITLNTKTLLGVSPIISVPNSLSVLFGWDLGWVVTLFYLLCVAAQLPIKGRRFGILDVLQFPVSFLSGWLVGWYSKTLSFSNPSWFLRLTLLALAILLTGTGVCMMVNMELAPNPADGLVDSISQRSGKSMGLCKNLFDLACAAVTVTLSLILGGTVIGIGLGTVATVLFTGRVIALVNRFLREPMRRMAGLSEA